MYEHISQRFFFTFCLFLHLCFMNVIQDDFGYLEVSVSGWDWQNEVQKLHRLEVTVCKLFEGLSSGD